MHQETSLLRSLWASFPAYRAVRSASRKLKRFGSTEEHWLRVVMNRETKKIVRSLSPETLSVLEISGDCWGDWMPFHRFKSVRHPAFDICKSALDESFDLIIAEQVFEHLLWPYRAGKNVFKMLNPGGHFLVTTPFLCRVHEAPFDCSRWTETGMRHLLAECGFALEHIRTGAWGNRACLRANFSRWTMYRPWLHSLKNEPEFPVCVWAIARKTTENTDLVSPPPIHAGITESGPYEMVQRWYQRLLLRDPDPEGHQFWTKQLSEGVAPDTFLAAILSSKEYDNRTTPKALIRTLFLDLTLRLPSVGEHRYWSEQAAHLERSQMVYAMLSELPVIP